MVLLALFCPVLMAGLIVPIVCAALFGNIADIVLYIIIYVRFNKGDTNKFVKFLDCNGVNKVALQIDFKDVEKLKRDYTALLALNIV